MREGWTYKKLGEVCEILNGFAFKSDKYVEQGIRVLRITNVQKGAIVDNDPKYYPYDEESNIKQYMLNENDLLMSLTGNVGRVGLLQKGLLPAALNQRVACLRLLSDIALLKYLFHLLNSDRFEKDSIFNAAGIAQKNMSTEWLKKYVIPIPPLSEQQRIVSELDLLSSIIEKKKTQLKEYDQLAQSIFYDMFGDPVTNEKGWEIGDIQSVYRVTSSKRILQTEWLNKGVPFYKVADIVSLINGNNVNPTTFIKKSTYDDLHKANLIPNKGDILVTSRGTLGKCYIIKENDNFYFQDGMITWLSQKEKEVSPIYIRAVFSSNSFSQSLLRSANSSTVAYISINQLSKKNIPLPPLNLQQSFASKIEAIERQKALIQQSINEVETLFNSRMDYYFN